MNLLLVDASELAGNRVVLQGRRAEHLIRVLRVTCGDQVRVGMIGGLQGTGRVLEMTSQTVVLELALEQESACGLEVELILALPRPIMLQRILKQATVLGVRRFHLIRSRRVEKSFFHSPVLESEKIRSLLLEGMEQAMDTWLPEVHIHPLFKPFVDDVLPTLKGQGLIAHPDAQSTYSEVPLSGCFAQRVLLAVGPEGGWNDFELEAFAANGFHAFSMGPRILHVDTAVVALLAQLQLLYELRNR